MGSTRKKVTVLMSAIIAVFLMAAGVFGAVLAARTGTVNSQISVTYTAFKVKATVSGTYQVLNSASATNLIVDNDSTKTTITFDGTETTGTDNSKSFDAVSIDLTETNKSVTFVYTITSTEDTDAIAIAMTSPTLTNTNLKVTSLSATNDGTAVSDFAGTISSLAAGKTAVITVVIEIDDLDKDVALTSASFSFSLTKATA